ncbi:MAG: PucR family transcriptional regulator ligand-binding domain-containing protein [Liquorilactobacillus ghanensis]|uniref:PucR family transcriptional regulator n=1 Tax=Liquorilactobacillus ghanensis TaxID=399370 RepID=UPI0039EB5BC3
MSVKITNILQLPSMKGSRVLTSKSDLNQTVTSVTVLEHSKINNVQKKLQDNIYYRGNEIVLTSFAGVKNDVTAQCRNIKYQAELGEVAIILFYVGIVMPTVDSRLIQTADEVNIAIICMPLNNPTLAYSDVIMEISNAIFNDQLKHPYLAVEMLKDFYSRSDKKRNLDAALQIISRKFSISLAIFNQQMILLNQSNWPQGSKVEWLTIVKNPLFKTQNVISRNNLVCEKQAMVNNGQKLYLFTLMTNKRLSNFQESQILQFIKIMLNMYHQNETIYINNKDMIDALLNGKETKALQIAKQLKIKVADFKNFWLIDNTSDLKNQHLIDVIRDLSRMFSNKILCEAYKNRIVILFSKRVNLDDLMIWGEQILSCFENVKEKQGQGIYLNYFLDLGNFSAYNKYFSLLELVKPYIVKIFPHKKIFGIQDLKFVKRCKDIFKTKNYTNFSKIIAPISKNKSLLQTLTTYFLDANTNILVTAQLECVHRNTIKYRLDRIENLLGFSIDNPIMLGDLTTALALERIVNYKQDN